MRVNGMPFIFLRFAFNFILLPFLFWFDFSGYYLSGFILIIQ